MGMSFITDESAKTLLDEIFNTIKVKDNATLSESIKAYEDTVNLLKDKMQKLYSEGYKARQKIELEEKIKNQQLKN